MTFTSVEFAESLDNQDALRKYRDEFVIPTLRDISNGDSGEFPYPFFHKCTFK